MRIRIIFFFAIAAACAQGLCAQKTVTRYEPFFALCTSRFSLGTQIALRGCLIDGVESLLLVDAATLQTSLVPAHEFHVHKLPFSEIRALLSSTAYCRALDIAARKSDTVSDAGLTHVFTGRRGIDVTVDLCPSHKNLDRDLFEQLIAALGPENLPAPVAIAITGVWMKQHPDDLLWLMQNVKENNLSITWINHSFHHRVKKDKDDRENFLLEKGTDLDGEILLIEQALLSCGITPSVFFRFPGLMSNQAIFDTVLSYGLIPVGSDAWLAKNQRPTDGSIVLVHANGNEPLGIQRFLALLREQKTSLKSRQWMLLDLRESLIEAEENRGIR